MSFRIIPPSILSYSCMLIFASCGGFEDVSDKEILNEFKQLSKETQNFFNSNTKVLCACLKEHKSEYQKLLQDAKPLIDDLKSGKHSMEEETVQEEIETKLMPGLAKFNDCNADAPDPSDEAIAKMQDDLRSFSGASVPGGKSDSKMHRLNIALLQKYCKDFQQLGSDMDQLSRTLFTSPYGQ